MRRTPDPKAEENLLEFARKLKALCDEHRITLNAGSGGYVGDSSMYFIATTADMRIGQVNYSPEEEHRDKGMTFIYGSARNERHNKEAVL